MTPSLHATPMPGETRLRQFVHAEATRLNIKPKCMWGRLYRTRFKGYKLRRESQRIVFISKEEGQNNPPTGQEMAIEDFHWLVGLLEGEGCFLVVPKSTYTYPMVKLNMTDIDVVARASRLMGSKKIHSRRSKNPKHKTSFETSISGSKALRFMENLLPFMGLRRQTRIREVFDQIGHNYISKMSQIGR